MDLESLKKTVIFGFVVGAARQMNFHFVDPEQPVTGPAARPHGADEGLTEQCRKALKELGRGRLAKRVRVMWNARMRSGAGRATWPSAVIELNPRLIEISESEVTRTLLHELAHLLAYDRAGKRRIQAHGVEWQTACGDLGIAGERATHSLALPSRKLKKRWRYECPKCGEGIERVRRFQKKVACYQCCRESGGSYQERFRLREVSLEAGGSF